MNAEAAPLGLYLHWPYCARVCPYCDFNVVRARGREAEAQALGEAMLTDLRAQAVRVGPRRLASIHFGGGTPSLMPMNLVTRFIAMAAELFAPEADLEIGLEANPLDADRFADLRAAGVARLSLGVQSLTPADLEALGRDHDAEQARGALDEALRLFPRVSADAIYGRPGQAPETWRAELGAIAGSGVGHLSAYQLTYELGTAFGRAADRGRMTPHDEDTSAGFWDATAETLTAAGFTAYEVSNWARSPADRSRHNLGYWQGRDYLGVGPGAHGRLTLDGVRHATAGARRPADFIRRVTETGTGVDATEILTPREAAEERLILGLRIADGVPFADLSPLSLDAEAPAVVELKQARLVKTGGGRLSATRRGVAVLDAVVRKLAA